MNLKPKRMPFAALAALSLGSVLTASEALACGGLFCSASTPVNQAAERIVFAHDSAANRVTAVIEILYDGPAESFAWILPVPGIPDVGISTNALLTRLQQATNPSYQVQRNWPSGACNGAPQFGGGRGGSAAGFPAGAGGGGGGGSVGVLASGTAGPYDYTVIDVANDVTGDPALEAIEWLVTNGYDPGTTGPDVLRPYLEAQLNLLAIKLTKQSTVGSIRPIKLSYDGTQPMIPIRPTAVAANDDMGVLVWVLGASRAVPLNYKALELNHVLLDWFNPQLGYNDVVIAAANETGDGQGFVTEDARPTVDTSGNAISEQIYVERFTVSNFRAIADSLANAELVVDVATRFSTFNGNFGFSGPFGGATQSGQVSLDGVADALARNLVLPPATSIADVLAAPSCYFEELVANGNFYCNAQPAPSDKIDLTSFDRTRFLTDVEALVIQPIEQTAQLFVDQPYMTRFYTTLSASEMTVDPVFAFNADLTDMSNLHTLSVNYTTGCNGDTSGPWQADVDGHLVRGEGNTWPITLDERAPGMPVNARILQLSTAGPGIIYEDNGNLIDQLLEDQFAPPGTGTGTGMGAGGPIRVHSSGGACSLDARPQSTTPAHLAWLLAGLVTWRWRQRRSPSTGVALS